MVASFFFDGPCKQFELNEYCHGHGMDTLKVGEGVEVCPYGHYALSTLHSFWDVDPESRFGRILWTLRYGDYFIFDNKTGERFGGQEGGRFPRW